MEELIERAVRGKQLLAFMYEGCYRKVEPYTYGCTTKGKDALRGFQVDGESRSDRKLGWRLFLIDEIENLELLNETYTEFREHYNPNDKGMSEIYVTA